MSSLTIGEQHRFDNFRRMASQWPTVLSRLGTMEEALGLTAPPAPPTVRQPRRGILPGMSLQEYDTYEDLRQLNQDFAWVEERIAALEAAVRAEAA
jgi:hypothetical protein